MLFVHFTGIAFTIKGVYEIWAVAGEAETDHPVEKVMNSIFSWCWSCSNLDHTTFERKTSHKTVFVPEIGFA